MRKIESIKQRGTKEILVLLQKTENKDLDVILPNKLANPLDIKLLEL